MAKNTNQLYYLLPVDILNMKKIITRDVITGIVQIRISEPQGYIDLLKINSNYTIMILISRRKIPHPDF